MADAALYRAKALGRDRVFLAEGPVPREPPRTKNDESVPSEAT